MVVLGRLGVAERVSGVMEPDPPEVNLTRLTSSSMSSDSRGKNGYAFGFLPGLEEDIVKCGVSEILYRDE